MPPEQIKFDDGAAYERYMGVWSQRVGEAFLSWLAPSQNLRWLDVGCGNGAFTEMILQRCSPSAVAGIDPSEAQLAFARSRNAASIARYRVGDAMALPFEDDSFDVAVMPLVIFFVPDPVKGVAEMVRVVSPGGIVAAYAWDLPGGGFPYQSLRDELETFGIEAPQPPSPDASRLDVLETLWKNAGLKEIETRAITVQRTFADFDDYWNTAERGPSMSGTLAKVAGDDRQRLKEKMRNRLPADSSGKITYSARANAVKGRV